MATEPLPSRVPEWRGSGCLTLAIFGAPDWSRMKMTTRTLPSWGPQSGEDSTRLHNPCLLGPQSGEKSTWPPSGPIGPHRAGEGGSIRLQNANVYHENP